jgi:hypothetical protein
VCLCDGQGSLGSRGKPFCLVSGADLGIVTFGALSP